MRSERGSLRHEQVVNRFEIANLAVVFFYPVPLSQVAIARTQSRRFEGNL